MIYDCFEQVAHLSEAFTLEPGDVIATGHAGWDRRGAPAVPGGPAEGGRRRCGSRSKGSATLENSVVEEPDGFVVAEAEEEQAWAS